MSELRLPENIATTLVNPTAYASDDLHHAYRWMRANNPLGVAEVEGFDPFWVVTSMRTFSRSARTTRSIRAACVGRR